MTETGRAIAQDSNHFYPIALGNDPLIFYHNDVSRTIIAIITEYNRAVGVINICDASSNGLFLYAPKEIVKEILELLSRSSPILGRS